MKKKKIFCVFGWMLFCFFFSQLTALWHDLSIVLATKPPTGKVPGPLLKWPEKGSDYADEGLKSLLLVKRGKDWKIREEEWNPRDQETRP
jgi:hypothetical protein